MQWVYQLKGQCFQVCTWCFHHGWFWCCCSSLSFSSLEWSTVCPVYPCYTMSSDSGAFYCPRLWPARLVTYLKAMETAEEEPHVDHFTVLPLRDGDVGDAESDLEDVPDDLENEDGFEAAGEFEVDYGSDEESESGDVDLNPEPSRKRVRRQDIPRSRKHASFDVPLDDSDLQTYLEEEFPYLPTQSPFRIWSEIFPPTLVDHIVEQTDLYAHRDCNFPAFSTGRENISSFLSVLLLSDYH